MSGAAILKDPVPLIVHELGHSLFDEFVCGKYTFFILNQLASEWGLVGVIDDMFVDKTECKVYVPGKIIVARIVREPELKPQEQLIFPSFESILPSPKINLNEQGSALYCSVCDFSTQKIAQINLVVKEHHDKWIALKSLYGQASKRLSVWIQTASKPRLEQTSPWELFDLFTSWVHFSIKDIAVDPKWSRLVGQIPSEICHTEKKSLFTITDYEHLSEYLIEKFKETHPSPTTISVVEVVSPSSTESNSVYLPGVLKVKFVQRITPAELVGPKGDQGGKGEVGPRGPAGEQGLRGKTGPQGTPGLRGEKGERGEKGSTGVRGPRGFDGSQGEKGDKSDAGPQGLQGFPGLQVPMERQAQEVCGVEMVSWEAKVREAYKESQVKMVLKAK